MKNITNYNSGKDPGILVTAYIEEPDILQMLVEKLAENNYDFDHRLTQIPIDWQIIGVSSIEAIVSGHIIMATENDLIEIPFVNCFLFTCTKSAKNPHNLTWNFSLS